MTDHIELLTIVTRANPVPDPVATAEHLDIHQSLLAAIDQRSEVMETPTVERITIKAGQRPPRRRAFWAFAAAFVVALIIVGIAALPGSDDEVVADEPTTTTTIATTTTATAPPTTVHLPEMMWTRLDHNDDLLRVPVEVQGEIRELVEPPAGAVAHGPGGFVAVGPGDRTDNPFGGTDVWISDDGVTWEPVPDPDGVFAGSFIESVVAGGPGYVAVGWDNPEGRRTNAVVLLSPDGLSWQRVDDPDLVATPGSAHDMRSIVRGGPGLVAYGSEVWLSVDGSDWSVVPRDAFANLESPLRSRYGVAGLAFSSMTVDPASGNLIGFRSGPHPEIWISEDGSAWVRALEPTVAWQGDGDGIAAVASDGAMLLAAGSIEEPRVMSLWASPDGGRSWSEIESIALQPSPDRIFAVSDLVWDGSRFILYGFDCAAPDWKDCGFAAWTGLWSDSEPSTESP